MKPAGVLVACTLKEFDSVVQAYSKLYGFSPQETYGDDSGIRAAFQHDDWVTLVHTLMGRVPLSLPLLSVSSLDTPFHNRLSDAGFKVSLVNMYSLLPRLIVVTDCGHNFFAVVDSNCEVYWPANRHHHKDSIFSPDRIADELEDTVDLPKVAPGHV